MNSSSISIIGAPFNGIGISPENLSRLFEAYYRGENVTGVQGIGLGLKIVKDCVDLHGGRIVVDSMPDEGSTFTVFLPIINLDRAKLT